VESRRFHLSLKKSGKYISYLQMPCGTFLFLHETGDFCAGTGDGGV